jgi:hypothetical protein
MGKRWVGVSRRSPKIGCFCYLGDPKDKCYRQRKPLVLLPVLTKLADGLRLEGISLKNEISPKTWFLRSQANIGNLLAKPEIKLPTKRLNN